VRTAVANAIGELRVVIEPRPAGSRATYIVKTNTPQELEAARQLFMGLSEIMEVRPLADGRVCAYALQHLDGCPSAFADIEALLRRHFEYVTCEHSVGGTMLDLVHTLCRETQSRLIEIERCGICGAPQPFPTTVVTISQKESAWERRRVYCTLCIANASGAGNLDLILELLSSDSEGFAWARRVEVVDEGKSPLPGGRSAFRLRPAA
jgi:hypothetical protein